MSTTTLHRGWTSVVRAEQPAPLDIPPPDASQMARRLRACTRQQQVVALSVGRGLSNRETGDRLCLSEHTVKNHLNAVYAALGIASGSSGAGRALAYVVGWMDAQEGSS